MTRTPSTRTPSTRTPRSRALLVVPLVTAALLGLVGCSASDDAGSDTAAGASGDKSVVAAGAPQDTGALGLTGAGVAVDRARVTPVERAVVRTASLAVEVDGVRDAAEDARGIATSAGGELAGEQSSTAGDGARSVLTLRVPGSKLDATLTRLAALGEEQDREVSTEDVTEQLVDLDSRVATQRASVARVRALLERASGLGDVVKIEGELAKREAELESLLARMRSVEGRVAMATVTLTLLGDGAEVAVEDEALGFTGGLERGWDAFTATARAVAATTGVLLPFLPFLLLALWAARRWTRRAPAVVVPQAGTRA